MSSRIVIRNKRAMRRVVATLAAGLVATSVSAGILANEHFNSAILDLEAPGLFTEAEVGNWYSTSAVGADTGNQPLNWISSDFLTWNSVDVVGIWQVVAVTADGSGTLEIDVVANSQGQITPMDWNVSVFGFGGPFSVGDNTLGTFGLGLPTPLASITRTDFTGTGITSAPLSYTNVDYLLVTAYADNVSSGFLNQFGLHSIALEVSAIPEPGTMVMGGLALLATVLGFRRKGD